MKLLNIVTLIALSTVVDHSSSRVVATTKTSEYETEYEYETIPKQEDDAVVVAHLLPTLLRGANKAVYQFLSDGDSEELSCVSSGGVCHPYTYDDCCLEGTLDEECCMQADCCAGLTCSDYFSFTGTCVQV